MNLVVDENISFAEEAFSQFGKVKLLHGRQITKNEINTADILIVRSITKVNKDLLEGTPIKFVGTATIGTDHIDLDYIKNKNIFFKDAAGCNADAVAEYVFTSISHFAFKNTYPIEDKIIGIVGIGNIGSRIAKHAENIGMSILKNDPPLERKLGKTGFSTLEKIFTADIVTFHVPLNLNGIDKTYHLMQEERLSRLNDGMVLINASRGQVIDNEDLVKILNRKKLYVNLDVWENEPDINPILLNQVNLATPHIAGYSLEGKVNGTKIIYDSLCNYLNVEPTWSPILPKISDNEIKIDYDGNLTTALYKIFNKIYPIKEDDNGLRKAVEMDNKERAVYFDKLRKNYPLRREFSNYKIKVTNADDKFVKVLSSFRFNVETI